MKSETNLMCNPCVIYLASEKLHSWLRLFHEMKTNAWAVWGPLRLGGPLDKTALTGDKISYTLAAISFSIVLCGITI